MDDITLIKTEMNNNHWKILVLLLKNIAEEKGITNQDISEKTGLIKSNITRVFSLKYIPSLEVFLSIANAVGVNFFFEEKDGKTDLNKLFNKAMDQLGRNPDNLMKN